MDIDLGAGMDGTDAARLILKERMAPIVFVTAHTGRDMVERVRAITRYGYVVKSSGDFVLESSIEMALNLFRAEQHAEERAADLENAQIETASYAERMHAACEELQRSNEELEQTNEELLVTNEDLKETFDQLVESEQRLARAETVARIGHWEIDLDKRIIRASAGAHALYGMERKIVSLEEAQSIPLPEYRAMLDAALRNLIERGEPYDVRFRIRNRADGRIYDIHSIAQYDARSRTVFGILADETEKILAQKAAQDNELKYRTLFTVSYAPMFIINPETGAIIDANPSASRFYGYDHSTLLTMNINEINRMGDEAVKSAMTDAISQSSNYFEFTHTLADGSTRQVEVVSSPLSDGDTTLLFTTIHDVTERNAALAENQRLLADKEMLLAEVHHRIKNNMTLVTSLLELNARRSRHASVKSALLDAKTRLLSMMRLYDRLYRSGNYTETDVCHYIACVLDEISTAYSSSGIRMECREEQIMVPVNVIFPLGIIINELITNALKYAFPEGTKGSISVSLDRNEQDIVLTIADNGRGLPEEIDIMTAESFGLSLVAMMIQQLGGSVDIARVPGTRFTIGLPLLR